MLPEKEKKMYTLNGHNSKTTKYNSIFRFQMDFSYSKYTKGDIRKLFFFLRVFSITNNEHNLLCLLDHQVNSKKRRKMH